MSYISLEFPLLLVCLTDKKFLHCDYPDWLRCSETSLVIKYWASIRFLPSLASLTWTDFQTFGGFSEHDHCTESWVKRLFKLMLFYDLQHCQKSTKKATCDLYLVDVVVALSVGEGFEVFKVFVGQVDADVVGVIVSRKEGGRRHCGVRQRRRISLSYPVLVPTE